MRAHSLVALAVLVGLGSACASSGQHATVAPRDPAAATAVTGEDIERTPSVPVEELMTSKFPGVWITRTADGALSIRIRGTTSVQASTEPLYIIDGTPIQTGPNGGLTGISPSDIASIQVLKDVAATTMYGLRGANGVIIIKTKVGSQ
ncbi:MAG: TonB-dependent receptor plug domain-containing protein [Gemmatimonadaceae bacterium]